MTTSGNRRGAGKAMLFAASSLLGSLVLAGLVPLPRALQWLFPLAGIGGYVLFAGRAIRLWRSDVDDLWRTSGANRRRRWSQTRLILTVGSAAVLAPFPCRAQQTIFNVPSADVLGSGQSYLELDELGRAAAPRSSATALRGVVGLGNRIEAGVNVGGFVAPGRSAPNAGLAAKWQPIAAGGFTLTVGGDGLLFVRGAADGRASVLGYTHAAYRLTATQTRLTAGAWVASAGFAKAGSTAGALAAIEQPIGSSLSLACDWFSGRNGIGYLTPGAILSTGKWTIYAGYSLKNRESKGDAFLIEIGFTL